MTRFSTLLLYALVLVWTYLRGFECTAPTLTSLDLPKLDKSDIVGVGELTFLDEAAKHQWEMHELVAVFGRCSVRSLFRGLSFRPPPSRCLASSFPQPLKLFEEVNSTYIYGVLAQPV